MAADPLENDELLLLKKRARRRLVGAVAFMVIALVVLSSVMESRPLPAEQKPVTVAIDGLSGPAAVTAPNAFASPTESGAVASEAAAGRTPAIAPSATGTGSAAKVTIGAEPARAPAATSSPRESNEPKPTTARSSRDDRHATGNPDKKPLAAKETGRAGVKPTEPGKAGGLSSSVVALSDAGKAAELQRKLKDKGLSAYTEQVQVGGKTLTRVRIGPYATRAELDKARAKLALMGL